jgi:hypothetical protein
LPLKSGVKFDKLKKLKEILLDIQDLCAKTLEFLGSNLSLVVLGTRRRIRMMRITIHRLRLGSWVFRD